ncbi:MAG TPA: ABC transporter permease [Bryobacteraceae bacterium]|nr:ABC transporter permease [Bryobacteraceae bacterium]
MAWWNRKRRESDLERELGAHLELETTEQQEAGVPPDQARSSAQRAFGSTAFYKESVREAWGWMFLDRLKQDLRYALRGMRKSPGFTITAVLSLALGIGANTAIFSLIDALMLRWLPVRNPQALVQVTMLRPSTDPLESFSYPLAMALSEHHEVFSNLCGFAGASFPVRHGNSVESVSGAWVTGAYYATLELEPAAGRLLTEQDDRPEAAPVAVISDDYWKRSFGGSADVVGRQIFVEGAPVTVVGVSPAGFSGANVGQTADITLPLGILPQIRPDRTYQLDSSSWWLRVLARPQPGISRAQAKARLAIIWPSLVESTINKMPVTRRRLEATTPEVVPGGTGYSLLRQQFRRPLMVLMTVVGLLLLIACANVANLLLARAAVRQREMAIRLAIGAGRARIVRQLLTEGLLLSAAGGAAGVLLAWAASRVLVNLLASGQTRGIVLDVAPDWRVLAFTAATACATGILFAIAPAIRGSAATADGALREKAAIARSRLAPLLVTMQISIALLLLIGAGLFVRTLRNLERVDTGFQGSGVLVASADAARQGYRGARAAAFYEELQQQVEHLRGISAASYSMITPLAGGGNSQDILVNGRKVSEQQIHFNSISRRYFETLSTPVLLGREFTMRDTAAAPRVAVVNQAFARRYMRGNPLGQSLSVSSYPRTLEFEVVGVVADTTYETLRQAAPPTVYCPMVQREGTGTGGFAATFVARVNGSLAPAERALRATIQRMLPGEPVEVHALSEQVERALVRERLMATLAAGFGVLGLTLAAVGLYGLLTYTVARRTNEIGIRLALGAMRGQVLWMVIRHVLALLGVGIAIGLPVAWSASGLISSMLFGVRGRDLLTIGAATSMLAAIALIAGFLPAWRASRVDPTVALRYE